VTDTTSPVISCPDPYTLYAGVDCCADYDGPPASAEDNCGDVTIVSDSTHFCGVGDHTITWIATDDWDNADTCYQTVTVTDTTSPVISCPDPYTLYAGVDCCADYDGPPASAEDNCGDVTIVPDSTHFCGVGDHTITWIATDDWDNADTCEQTITVVDTISPTLHCPSDTLVECLENVPDINSDNATAEDNCTSVVDISVHADTVGTGCPDDTMYIYVTYTATDSCNNESSCLQRIAVVDTTPPVLYGVPEDETVLCEEVPDTADVTATDNCDPDPIVEFVEERTDGKCEDEYTLTRIWTATDSCGNAVSDSEVITVIDITPPVFTYCPGYYRFACLSEVFEISPDSAQAEDGCGGPVTMDVDTTITGDGCPSDPMVILVTYTARDQCENPSYCRQKIVLIDTIPPELVDVPPDTLLECDELPDPAEVTATDNCDPTPEVDLDEITEPGSCEYEYTIKRTWTATDWCGNQTDTTQTIAVVDTTPPEIIGLPDTTVIDCDDEMVHLVPDVEDNCDPHPELTRSILRIPGDCQDNYTVLRIWTATDVCGNDTVDTHVVIVQDTTKPEIACPSDEMPPYQCLEDVPDPDPDRATATDNCDESPIVTVRDSSNGGEGCKDDPLIITRIYTATDDCGNESSCFETITVIDDVPPEITCPPDVIVDADAGSCGADADNVYLGEAFATDNCPGVVVVNDAPPNSHNDGDYPIGTTLVTWTAIDHCGQTDTCIQKVIVRMHVDAKPTSCPNPLQKGRGGGVVPFAILGCDGFDVSHIDPHSVRVEGLRWERRQGFNYEDVTQPVPVRLDSCDCTELGGDGYLDLTFKVDKQKLVQAIEERLERVLVDREEIAVYVTARLAEDHGAGELVGMDCMIVILQDESGIQAERAGLSAPKSFSLSQNRPNPLQDATTIQYELPIASSVKLVICDKVGAVVRVLVDGTRDPGCYSVLWDGKDSVGNPVPSGIYFYRLRAEKFICSKQMILIRK